MLALAYVVAPDGCSGYGGVISAGPVPPIVGSSEGSNIGVQLGSATVFGFPSMSACRIAVIGRQKFPWYLSLQVVIRASAAVRSSMANRRALSLTPSPRWVMNRRAMAL